MFLDDRRALRHLHAGDTQRTGPDDIRGDEQFSRAELLPADLVQEGRAEVGRVVGGAARRLAHRERAASGLTVLEEDQRGDVEGQPGMGASARLFDLRDAAPQTEILRDVKPGHLCLLFGGYRRAGQTLPRDECRRTGKELTALQPTTFYP